MGTTLNGSCSATSTSCVLTDATKVDLSSLPGTASRLIIYDNTNWDELRACSVSSNTVSWCYDPSPLPRHTFANGTNVIQSKVTGASTHFITDVNAAICPAEASGFPSLPGVSSYSTGTVTLTANSASVSLSGGSWASPTTLVGDFIQVQATNNSAATFTFMAQITVIGSTTTATLARVFPADATTGSYSYKIMPATRTFIAYYTHPLDAGTPGAAGGAKIMFGTTGCESETAFYLNPIAAGLGNSYASSHDITGLTHTQISGKQYSITDTTGWVNQTSTGGLSFYGEGLASAGVASTSGLAEASAASHAIASYMVRSPWGNADGSGYPPLFLGGIVLEAWNNFLTDPNTQVGISDLRAWANYGLTSGYGIQGVAANGCNATDTRDGAYANLFVVLAAIYDPDTTSTSAPGGISWRAYWQSFMSQMQTNDAACRQSDYSWSNNFTQSECWCCDADQRERLGDGNQHHSILHRHRQRNGNGHEWLGGDNPKHLGTGTDTLVLNAGTKSSALFSQRLWRIVLRNYLHACGPMAGGHQFGARRDMDVSPERSGVLPNSPTCERIGGRGRNHKR